VRSKKQARDGLCMIHAQLLGKEGSHGWRAQSDHLLIQDLLYATYSIPAGLQLISRDLWGLWPDALDPFLSVMPCKSLYDLTALSSTPKDAPTTLKGPKGVLLPHLGKVDTTLSPVRPAGKWRMWRHSKRRCQRLDG
jgi:hypothetical protein